jgi:hypothetical protein
MDVLLTDLIVHLQDRGVADITDGLLDFFWVFNSF